MQYNDYDFETSTSRREVRLRATVNNSHEQHGPDEPPARPAGDGVDGLQRHRPALPARTSAPAARRWAARATTSTPTLDSERKFPAFYDNKWFIAEWNNGWIKTANLGANGAMTKVDPFALGTGYKRPMDLDFGPDGALYVIEWGSGFGGDNADSGVYRIDYVAGDKAPIAEATRLGRPAASRRWR